MSDLSKNPLVNPPRLPHDVPPLDVIKTADYLPALREGIRQAKADIEAIKTNREAPTFDNTIAALEFSAMTLNRVATVFGNISGSNSDAEMTPAMKEEFKVALTRHGSDVMLDGDLFSRVKSVYEARDSLDLNKEQKMLLENTYKGFVRSGALLKDEDKAKLREYSEKLAKLQNAYAENGLAADRAYKRVVTDENELRGLPPRVKNILRAQAKGAGLPEGHFLILLSPPPIDILTHCDNRALREEIQKAMGSKTYKNEFDNTANAMEIVKIRHEMAKLLGYDSHAAYVLDDRMAKTPDAVMDFLKKNEKAYRPAAEEYLQKVRDYAKGKDGLDDLQPWDLMYYGRRLQEETFDLDVEAVRPYFDLEKVLDGLRHHAEKLFNIEMTETKGKYPVYHPDVKVYEVRSNETGETIGLFYADYYARPGAKRGGAWMSTFRERGIEAGENKFAIVTNVCNFDKPAGDQPTLLSLDEVRTLFHEFGHGLHGLLAKGDYPSITGTNVKWDWVELPSQLQENWAKTKEVLDTFARHYQTGEAIPADLIKKINDMETFDAGYVGLRQTFLGLLDMKWHATNPDKIESVEKLEDDLVRESWLFPRTSGPLSANFGHIFAGGYSAGYYSYKWAEVLEADIFESFAEKGLYDRETADKVREFIYAAGGTEEPMDLYIKAKGRAPDPDALFRREGILPPHNDNSGPAPVRKSNHKPG